MEDVENSDNEKNLTHREETLETVEMVSHNFLIVIGVIFYIFYFEDPYSFSIKSNLHIIFTFFSTSLIYSEDRGSTAEMRSRSQSRGEDRASGE